MILVDTSIWADHLGNPDWRLVGLLEQILFNPGHIQRP